MSQHVESLQPIVWHEPRSTYDVVIVGGGGHGLATAYYLATRHGITNVAVVEADYIASGNTGRNTTIIRANYAIPEAIRFYDHSMKLYEGLEAETGGAIFHCRKGHVWIAHSEMGTSSSERPPVEPDPVIARRQAERLLRELGRGGRRTAISRQSRGAVQDVSDVGIGRTHRQSKVTRVQERVLDDSRNTAVNGPPLFAQLPVEDR